MDTLPLLTLTWAQDGNTIITTDKSDNLTFIDPRGGPNKQPYVKRTLSFDDNVEVNESRLNAKSDLLFVSIGIGSTGSVRVLNYPSFVPIGTFPAHTSSCTVIDFCPKGRYFATGGGDALTVLCKPSHNNSRGSRNTNICPDLH
jgi:THO complex subunit 3